MSSFLASETSGDMEISYNEFKTLLWLFTEAEPTPDRVKNEFKTIDINKDNSIQLKEWMVYILPLSKEQFTNFDFSLRKLFDMFDADENGEIEKDELI